MSIKNFGVLAFASAVVATGHGHYGHGHLHSTGSSAAAIPTGLPACWSTCFKEADVSSPEALCDNEKATNCIKVACATEDVASYKAWLKKQCGAAPYPVGGNNGTAVGPTGTGAGTGGVSTSICTETSTLIYQTTTAYSTYLITHTISPSAPGGYGSSNTDVPVGPATETGSAPGGYGSSAPSNTPNSPIGGEGEGEGEECSEVTVTETERTTVTVTAGNGGAPSAPSSYAAPSTSEAATSEAPEAPSSPYQPAPSAPAPTTYAPSNTEGSAEAPSSYVSEAGEAPSSYAAPPAYSSPAAAPTSEAPAPSYGGETSTASPKPSHTSSPPSYGAPDGWKGKRGLAYNYTSDVVDSLFEGAHIGWAQTWEAKNWDRLPAGFPFIPTLHSGDAQWTTEFGAQVETALSNGAEYIFGQNEPDNAGQANETPAQAADIWRANIEPFAGRAKLCAPSVTNAPAGSGMGLDWLDEFMKECSDCTIDCVNVHWYDSRGNDASVFKEQVTAASKYGKPVFVGEFAGIGSNEEISAFLDEVMPWMDARDEIVGYAYFMVFQGLLVDGSSVSPYGQTYCG